MYCFSPCYVKLTAIAQLNMEATEKAQKSITPHPNTILSNHVFSNQIAKMLTLSPVPQVAVSVGKRCQSGSR